MTAIYVAANRPDLVKGILLIDPPLYAQYGIRDEKETFEQRRALANKSVEELVAGGLPANQAHLLSPSWMGTRLARSSKERPSMAGTPIHYSPRSGVPFCSNTAREALAPV
jgi:hypothetical protein